MYPNIHQFEEISIDTETTGLEVYNRRDKAFGISISTPDGKDYYWDIREQPSVIRSLQQDFKSYRGLLVFANAPFDYFACRNIGVDLTRILEEERFRDVIGRACLIDEHLMSYDLDYLAKKYLGIGKVDIVPELHKIFGGRNTKNVQMQNLHRAPSEVVSSYAKRDTRTTLDLYYWQQGEIARQGIESIVEFEETVTPVIVGMMDHGIRIDRGKAELAVSELNPYINEIQQRLERKTGMDGINVNSPKQIKEIFQPTQRDDGEWYTKDGILLPKTPAGNASLAKEILHEMDTELSRSIVEQRSLINTRDTFLNGHVLSYESNGRIHPSINQNKGEDGGTGTGRLSVSKPAMQQIPSRNKKIASIVKDVFLPDEGHLWYESDLSSFEVRIFAHLINNPVINQKFAESPETDFHQYVADLTGFVRNAEYSGQANAKQLNLSMIFNQGEGTTCEKMGFPTTPASFVDNKGKVVHYLAAGPEGKQAIEKYHRTIPGIRELAKLAKSTAEKRGYVYTMQGRRLRFEGREKRFAYKASGLLIQANAADINKRIIRDVYKACRSLGGRLLLNTHDSYSKSLPESTTLSQLKEIQAIVSDLDHVRIPLIMEINKGGKTWWESYNAKRLL